MVRPQRLAAKCVGNGGGIQGATMKTTHGQHRTTRDLTWNEERFACFDCAGLCECLLFLGFDVYSHPHWRGGYAGVAPVGYAVFYCRLHLAGVVSLARFAASLARKDYVDVGLIGLLLLGGGNVGLVYAKF